MTNLNLNLFAKRPSASQMKYVYRSYDGFCLRVSVSSFIPLAPQIGVCVPNLRRHFVFKNGVNFEFDKSETCLVKKK